jgi:hypothetical protein
MNIKQCAGILFSLSLLAAATALGSGGQIEIYGIVSKVVLEPNDAHPERVQIWGTFTLVDNSSAGRGATLTPQRGYLYFNLPTESNARNAAMKEVSDFQVIAGKGQAVAFGRFGYIGAFNDDLIKSRVDTKSRPPYVLNGGGPGFNGSHATVLVRPGLAPPSDPETYPLDMGLTKLSPTGNLAAIVKQLEQAK